MNNQSLNRAKAQADDEWYTPYDIIESEVSHYVPQFYGKSVLCNCNDSVDSRFLHYFVRNFNKLKLKELTCIQYFTPQVIRITAVHTVIESENSYVCDVNGYIKPIESGDFLSEDSINCLKRCDIVCTNPPFSKFKELFNVIMEHQKKFLLISNHNATTYSKVFPHIKQREIFVGYSCKSMNFRVPPTSSLYDWKDMSGQKWRRLGNAIWLTNLTPPSKPDLELTQLYDPNKYPTYDTYNAIHVDKTKNIPIDYKGLMAVPITFLNYDDSKQFEIIGEANHGRDNEYDLFDPILHGKHVFKRVVIKWRR